MDQPADNDQAQTIPVPLPDPTKTIDYKSGALYAINGLVLGVVAWIIIWQMGIMASIVSFGMAWAILWFYTKGAGGFDRKSAYIVIAFIVAGIILCILSGIASDLVKAIMKDSQEARDAGVVRLLTNPNFWGYFVTNLFGGDGLIVGYTTDILWSIALAGAGVFQTIYGALRDTSAKQALAEQPTAEQSAAKETPAKHS